VDKERSILGRKGVFIVTQQRVGLSHDLLSEAISLIVELWLVASSDMRKACTYFAILSLGCCFEGRNQRRRPPALTFGHLAGTTLSITLI
jgi:hypothetical protein